MTSSEHLPPGPDGHGPDPDHGGHGHGHGAGHGHHGHANDQGFAGAFRYLRRLPRMWRSPVNDAVVELIDLQPGECGVDVGAGMGAGAMRAIAPERRIVAVEPTPFMRRVLTIRRAMSRHRSRIEVVDGTAEHLPVEDASIDALWAVNTMHHWSDLDAGIAEIARVLRPGGRLVLVDEAFADPTHPEHERFGANHDPADRGFTAVDADGIARLARARGLTEIEAPLGTVADRPVIGIAARRAPRGPGAVAGARDTT